MFAPVLLFLVFARQPSAPGAGSTSAAAQPPSGAVSDPSQPDSDGVYHHPAKVPALKPPRVTHSAGPEIPPGIRGLHCPIAVGLIVTSQG